MQESKQPMVPALLALIGEMRWTACQHAVDVFQELMQMQSGPMEQQRWQGVLERLEIIPAAHHAGRFDSSGLL